MLSADRKHAKSRPARPSDRETRIVQLASRARAELIAGKRRDYRRTLKALAPMADALGARIIDHRDLAGMVVGLEYRDRPGHRNWVFLA